MSYSAWTHLGDLITFYNDSITFESDNRNKLTTQQRNPIIISIVLTPIIVVVGVVGNIVNFITLHHPSMHHTTYRILLVLAVIDLVFLLHAAVLCFLDYTLLTDPVFANHLSATLIPIVSAYTGHIAAGTSTWLIVFVSSKRWTDIYCPLSVMTGSKWTKTCITIVISLILIITSVFYLPLAFKFYSFHDTNHTHCAILTFNSLGMSDRVYWFYGIFLNATYRAIPMVVLLVVSAVTIKKLRRVWVVKLRHQSTMEPTYLTIASFEQTRVTIILVILSLVTALSLIPGFIYFLFYRKDQHRTYQEDRGNVYLVSNRLIMLPEFLKASITSLIYLSLSPNYRYALRKIFCCSRQTPPKSSMKDILKELYNYKVPMNLETEDSDTSSSQHIYALSQVHRISRFVPSVSISPWRYMAQGLTDDMLNALGKSESNLQFLQKSAPSSWWKSRSEVSSSD